MASLYIFLCIYTIVWVILSYEDFFLPSLLPGNEKMSSTSKK